LEKPATFDVTILKEMGRLMAYTTANVRPTIRPAWLLGSNFQIRSRPTTETMVLRIIAMMRDFGIYVVARQDRLKKTISAPPCGICRRRDLKSLNPNPAVIMAEN
jgi:hypothetical protein